MTDRWIDVGQLGIPGLRTRIAEGTPATLYFPSGTYVVGSLEIPVQFQCIFDEGALVEGSRLHMMGPLQAGPYQIFGDLEVQLDGSTTPTVIPQWWGAVADGSVSSGAPIASMLAAMADPASPRTARFPPGTYIVERPLLLRAGRRYEGDGAVLRRPLRNFRSVLASVENAETVEPTVVRGISFDSARRDSATLLKVESGAFVVDGCRFSNARTGLDVRSGASVDLSNCSFHSCDLGFRVQGDGLRVSVSQCFDRDVETGFTIGPVSDAVVQVEGMELGGRFFAALGEECSLQVGSMVCEGASVGVAGGEVVMSGVQFGRRQPPVEPPSGEDIRLEFLISGEDSSVQLAGCQVVVDAGFGVAVEFEDGATGGQVTLDGTLFLAGVFEGGKPTAVVTGGQATLDAQNLVTVAGGDVPAGFFFGVMATASAVHEVRSLPSRALGGFFVRSVDALDDGDTTPVLRLVQVPSVSSFANLVVDDPSGRARVEHLNCTLSEDDNRVVPGGGATTFWGRRTIVATRPPAQDPGLLGDLWRLRVPTAKGYEWVCVKTGGAQGAEWSPISCRRGADIPLAPGFEPPSVVLEPLEPPYIDPIGRFPDR